MRSAEGGQEVIERVFVGKIDRCQIEVHLVVLFVEDVVLSERGVEEAAGGDARRVVVGVFCAGRGDRDQRRLVLRREAGLET